MKILKHIGHLFSGHDQVEYESLPEIWNDGETMSIPMPVFCSCGKMLWGVEVWPGEGRAEWRSF